MTPWSPLKVDYVAACFMLVSCVAEEKGDFFFRKAG
jgi:hypothetical protein